MTLIIVGIGEKEDGAPLIGSGKKVVIVISVKQEKYVSIVITGHDTVIVLVNAVQYVTNI